MTNLMKITLTVCLALVFAAPALARPNPAATKSGGDVMSGPDVVTMPTIPGTPVPYPNKADVSTQGPPVRVLIKTYTDSRDEALKKLPGLIVKPPKDPNAARGQLTAIMVAPQAHLVAVNKVVYKRKASGSSTGAAGFDVIIEQQYLEMLYKLASQALEHQIAMAKSRAALQKAIEDAPQIIKALAEELKSVQEKANDYLKKVGERIDQREQQLAAMKKAVEAERERLRKEGEAKLKASMAEHQRQKSLLAQVDREMASVRSAVMDPPERERRVQVLQKKHLVVAASVQKSKVVFVQAKQKHVRVLSEQDRKLAKLGQQLAEAKSTLKRKMEQQRKDRERAEKFVETVAGNVQHAWENILKTGKDLFDKEMFKPAAYKKRAVGIDTLVHQINHSQNAPAPIKITAVQISKDMKKAQEKYKKVYDEAVAARKPLQTGSAMHGIAFFKGVKPSQITTRAKQAFIDLVKKKRKYTGPRPGRQVKSW